VQSFLSRTPALSSSQLYRASPARYSPLLSSPLPSPPVAAPPLILSASNFERESKRKKNSGDESVRKTRGRREREREGGRGARSPLPNINPGTAIRVRDWRKELSQNSSVSTRRTGTTVIYLEYSRGTDAIVTLDVFELHRNAQRIHT